jgi:hypothetical protein
MGNSRFKIRNGRWRELGEEGRDWRRARTGMRQTIGNLPTLGSGFMEKFLKLVKQSIG